MNLHLFDCSHYIYAGAARGKEQLHITRGVRESNGAYESNTAPVGGVKFFLNELSTFMKSDAVLMPVIDSTPTIKRKMYEDMFGLKYGYKGDRPEAPSHISLQKEYLYTVLRDCNFLVQRAEGYESDDLIYTLVQMYKDDFNKIYIHTRDGDLSFLVSENVEISKVGIQGKDIDIYNYPESVLRNDYVYYNTILFRYLYKGSHNNVPGVGMDWASRIDALIKPEDWTKLGDLDLCREYLRKATIKYDTLSNVHKLLPTFNLVAPLMVPYDYIDDAEQDIDYEKFNMYYMKNWCQQNDVWGCEQLLEDYIDKYYD